MINWPYQSFFQHLSVDLYLTYNEAINTRARVLKLKDTWLNQDQTLKTFFYTIYSFIWNFLAASQFEQMQMRQDPVANNNIIEGMEIQK